jgi:hypothetical protein
MPTLLVAFACEPESEEDVELVTDGGDTCKDGGWRYAECGEGWRTGGEAEWSLHRYRNHNSHYRINSFIHINHVYLLSMP